MRRVRSESGRPGTTRPLEIFGAPGLTPAQRDQLVKLVQAATETPAWKERLSKMGWSSWFLAGDQFKAFLEEDTRRVAAIMESLGLKK